MKDVKNMQDDAGRVEREETDAGSEVDEDAQMREALRARSMFLRRFDGDDEETFGDEDMS